MSRLSLFLSNSLRI